MKIVDRNTLLALPAGTVFMHYSPGMFRGLYVKGQSILDADGEALDWWERRLDRPGFPAGDCNDDYFEALAMLESGAELPASFDTWARDGLFDAEQRYAVFDRADAQALTGALDVGAL